MLPEDLDEVKRVETQQEHQLVLALPVVAGGLRDTQKQQHNELRREQTRQGSLHITLTSKEKNKQAYLEDVQDFVRFLLGDDGVVVEAAELPLEPEGVDVARMQVLLLGRHHVAGDELKKNVI